MGKRYEFILLLLLHLRFEVGLTEVEQGVGVQQFLAMRIAGATVKNRTSCQE